jgi:hypothetical protein
MSTIYPFTTYFGNSQFGVNVAWSYTSPNLGFVMTVNSYSYPLYFQNNNMGATCSTSSTNY